MAPFWDDLYPVKGTNQNVFVAVTGTAPNRELVVEWRDVRAFDCPAESSATIRFQVVFFESNSDILFNYTDATFGGECARLDRGFSATVGVQVAKNRGVQWSYGQGTGSIGNQSVNDNFALRWQLVAGNPPPTNPVPTITSLTPTNATIYGPEFTLTVQGTGFVPASQVQVNDNGRATTFISDTEVRALIPASDLGGFFPSPLRIAVVNPTPGGGRSNQLNFTLNQPQPTITGLSPSSATAGGLSFGLTVVGTGFTSGSRVFWNGRERSTAHLSRTQVRAPVPLNDIATPGTAQVTVVNGGLTSNAVTFAINPPLAAGGQLPPPYVPPSRQIPQPLYLLREDAQGPLAGGADGREVVVPPRFLGWKHALRQGSDFLRRFARPRAGQAIPLANLQEESSKSPARGSPHSLAVGSSTDLPGFEFRESLPAGFIPTSVAAGDMNQDGKTDWVVANGGDSTLWLYFGRGDGISDLPRILPLAGRSPLWVELVDLQGNGILDLVVAEADSGTVGVLLGNGDGTFQKEAQYFLPAPPLTLLVEDFNGDGSLDVLAGLAEFDYPVALLPGDSSGRFGPPIFRRSESSADFFVTIWMAAADFDLDGDLDLLTVDLEPNWWGVHSRVNDGTGVFKELQYIAASSGMPLGPPLVHLASAAGDINGDGCPDAVSVHSLGGAHIYLGRCDGHFQFFTESQPFGMGDAGVAVALTDINGDNILDLISSGIFLAQGGAFGQEAGNLLSVMLGNGQGGFNPARVYRGEGTLIDLAIADLNGDAVPDVIAANQDSDTATVFLNDGNGGFGTPIGAYIGYFTGSETEGTINAPWTPFLPRDVNTDGSTDLSVLLLSRLVAEPVPLSAQLNDGTGSAWSVVRSPEIDFTFDYQGFTLADFRNAGRPDFVAVGQQFSSKGPLLVFSANQGNGVFGFPRISHPAGAQGALGVGDFNQDGRLDLAVADQTGTVDDRQRLAIFLGNGDDNFTTGQNVTFGGTLASAPEAIHVHDFNGDGRLDLLVWLFSSPLAGNTLFQFLGNGDGTFAAPRVLFQNIELFAVEDLNHDGRQDLVELRTQAFVSSPEYAIYYLGQPDGTFAISNTYAPYAGLSFTPFRGSTESSVGDINGDGHADIVAFQMTTDFPRRAYAQILVGNGDGTFTPSYDVYPFHKPAAPQLVADVTGDGHADLIELDGFHSSFHVMRSVPAPALQLSLVSNPTIGTTGRARVNLNVAAPAATTVLLPASDPAISVPHSVTIPGGSVEAEFNFTIGSGFDATRVFQLQAEVNGQVASVEGTQAVGDVGLAVLADPPIVNVTQGQTTLDLIFNVVSLGGYTTVVQLSCSGLPAGAGCAFVQDALEIPAGGFAGTTFAISTSSATPTGSHIVTVRATDGVVTETDSFELRVFAPANLAPSANAGSDRMLAASSNSGTSVQLDGANSTDPEGASLT